MANTYTQLFIHVVFAVSGRRSLLPRSKKEDIHRYITGIIQQRGCKLIAINSMPDHMHILLAYAPKVALSDVLRDVKAVSSKLINENGWVPSEFRWQTGYGAFSVSPSQVEKVVHYIENQEEHHRIKTFREEYIEFLEAASIEYDLQYIFKPLEDEAAPPELPDGEV
jgi:REP element-mobilizing transposase RayT